MPDYRARLDRVEAAIAPQHDYLGHVILVGRGEVCHGETREEAAAKYATTYGFAVAELLARGVFVQFVASDSGL